MNNIDKSTTHELILFDYKVNLWIFYLGLFSIFLGLIEFLSKKLMENVKKLDELKNALKYYQDLPPNLGLAQAKVEEIKKEIVR